MDDPYQLLDKLKKWFRQAFRDYSGVLHGRTSFVKMVDAALDMVEKAIKVLERGTK